MLNTTPRYKNYNSKQIFLVKIKKKLNKRKKIFFRKNLGLLASQQTLNLKSKNFLATLKIFLNWCSFGKSRFNEPNLRVNSENFYFFLLRSFTYIIVYSHFPKKRSNFDTQGHLANMGPIEKKFFFLFSRQVEGSKKLVHFFNLCILPWPPH